MRSVKVFMWVPSPSCPPRLSALWAAQSYPAILVPHTFRLFLLREIFPLSPLQRVLPSSHGVVAQRTLAVIQAPGVQGGGVFGQGVSNKKVTLRVG